MKKKLFSLLLLLASTLFGAEENTSIVIGAGSINLKGTNIDKSESATVIGINGIYDTGTNSKWRNRANIDFYKFSAGYMIAPGASFAYKFNQNINAGLNISYGALASDTISSDSLLAGVIYGITIGYKFNSNHSLMFNTLSGTLETSDNTATVDMQSKTISYAFTF